MDLEKIVDSICKLSKKNTGIIMFFIIIFLILIIIDLFVWGNSPNIGLLKINDIRFIYYAGFFVSVISFGIQKIVERAEKQKYFNIMNNLDADEVEVLKCFAIAKSSIAEIKNNISVLNNLENAGFEIYCIGELYFGNTRTIDGRVYSDLMVKAQLQNGELLKYIKAYFKKTNH